MRKPSILLAICMASSCVFGSGCMLAEPFREISHASMRTFRPRTSDYRDLTDEVEDEWAIAGQEGRGDKPMETGGDPFLSPKAQSIERNLGFRN